jgi:MFS family permease
MLAVLVIAAVFYLPGLAPEPAFGSLAWWGWRVPWLVVLGLVMVGVLVVLRPLERGVAAAYERVRPGAGPHRGPGPDGPHRSSALWFGLGASVLALSRFAVRGFAPDGRFPTLPALGLAVGLALVLLAAVRPPAPRSGDLAANDAVEEAA